MTADMHAYDAQVVWTGNTGDGTSDYTSYERRYRVQIAGKPDLVGTADAAFRGEADTHTPEDLFVSAIAACHMLTYLALCARSGVRVLAYEDAARGTMRLSPDGGGRFEEVVLRPRVTIASPVSGIAARLHEAAHDRCFIANSCRVPIRYEPDIEVASHSATEPIMQDLAIALDHRPGALAEMGEALGRAGLSIEGGGAFVVDGRGAAHFLFEDGEAARGALEVAGIRVVEVRDVLVQRLKQEVPGQLGELTRRMAEAGVNIEVLYSDHDHRLILVADDIEAARVVSETWARD